MDRPPLASAPPVIQATAIAAGGVFACVTIRGRAYGRDRWRRVQWWSLLPRAHPPCSRAGPGGVRTVFVARGSAVEVVPMIVALDDVHADQANAGLHGSMPDGYWLEPGEASRVRSRSGLCARRDDPSKCRLNASWCGPASPRSAGVAGRQSGETSKSSAQSPYRRRVPHLPPLPDDRAETDRTGQGEVASTQSRSRWEHGRPAAIGASEAGCDIETAGVTVVWG
jgi:hypothetical protein